MLLLVWCLIIMNGQAGWDKCFLAYYVSSQDFSEESLLLSIFVKAFPSWQRRCTKRGSTLAVTFVNVWFMLIKLVAQENEITCLNISFCSVIMIQVYISQHTIIILLRARHCTSQICKNRHCHVSPRALLNKGCADPASRSTRHVCKHAFFLHRLLLREKALNHPSLLEIDRIYRRVGI